MNIRHYVRSSLLAVGVILCLSVLPVDADKANKAQEVKGKAAAVTKDAKAAQKKEKPPENAAVINGKPISYERLSAELNNYVDRLNAQGRQTPPEMMDKLRSQLLKDMIDGELLFQESRSQKIVVKDDEVNKEIESLKAQSNDPKQFKAFLDNMKITEDDLKDRIERNLSIKNLIEKNVVSSIKIKDEDVKKFYDSNPNYFKRPEEVKASHILIKTASKDSDEDKAKAKEKIKKLQERIKAGEDFVKLAKENSECPSSSKGGDLGFFDRSRMVKPFSDAAFKMKVNEISDIVESRFGYHLIKVTEKRKADTVPFDEAKERIVQNLKNERIREQVQKYIAGLREKAKIEKFIQ
ncbi:MAG: peptidylprolyl isomerase [Desulfobacteraceae bacterium]|nr:peptidylprolyl isomerase [Desulfobacteraceae bacterium]